MKSKILSFFMTVALIITIMPQMVLGANGPCSDEYPPAYVGLFSESTSKYIFSNFSQDKVEKVSGVTYDKKTNTLTLNNVKMQEYNLVTNVMGDDFKVVIKGENQLRAILIWGDGYGGNLTISGNGKLIINKNKKQKSAISMYAEGTKGLLTIEKNVNLELYSQKGAPVIETVSASNGDLGKAIAIKGKTSAKVNVKQVKEKYQIPVSVKAYRTEDRYQLAKFEKDGKFYGGNAKYDNMGEETGEYQMYEMLQDESIEEGNVVWVAKPIETQSSIKPENSGYKRVVENGQDAKFNEVIIMDTFRETYLSMYHSTADGKDYGVYTVTYINDENPAGIPKYTIYTVKDDSILGKVATPVEGKVQLLKLPDDFEQKIEGEYYSYNYSVGLEKLAITGDTKTAPPVKKIGTAKIKTAKNNKKKAVSVTWGKVNNARKYQLQYSLNKKFANNKKYKTKTITTAKTKANISKLKKKKTYYFRVRGVNGKNVGKWSAVKRVKVNK
nr:fibronectin type III domain-containing protein [uncultured Eubacterium sp.]